MVTNGGFSLISEAVYLHCPVLSFPLSDQFEQFVNGAKIEQLRFGRCFSRFSSDAVKAYLYDLPRFAKNLSDYRQDGNQETFNAVDQFITDVETGENTSVASSVL